MKTRRPITVPGIERAVPDNSRITATPTATRIAVTFSASHGIKYTLLFYKNKMIKFNRAYIHFTLVIVLDSYSGDT